MPVTGKPLAELHLHLEGAIRPETLQRLEPRRTAEEIAAHYQYSDFRGFLSSYLWVIEHLERPEHYALALERLLDELDAQGVRYAEITLSAGVILWRNQPLDEIWDALREASRHPRVEVAWIPDATRQWGPVAAFEVAEFAAAHQHQGVVAFSIGGDEARGLAVHFREVYEWARRQGLRLLAHGGEVTGPQSVWQALEIGAERIGHGIRAVDDPALVSHLERHRIPLEVCVSSNLATGAIPSLQAHPLRRLYDAGVPIVLNSDDPAMFHTTLEREYRLAESHFGFTPAEIEELRRNAFRFAFRPGAAALAGSS